jgi:uncharacterized protein YkwD
MRLSSRRREAPSTAVPAPSATLRVLVVLVAGLLAVLMAPASPAAAATRESASESTLLSLLNSERSARGLASLRPTTDLVDVARKHTDWMADNRVLQHNGSLASDVTGWLVLSENVGYGGNADVIHDALMNSAGHRANILDSRVSQVGIGAARDARGTLWITQVFRKPDSSTANAPTAGALSLGSMTPDVAIASSSDLFAAERSSSGSTAVRRITSSGVADTATKLGGVMLEAPAIESVSGQLSVAGRGTDRQVWLRRKTSSTSSWQSWKPLGGIGTSRPAVTSWGTGRLDVVIRGADGSVWMRSMAGEGQWGSWRPLGGLVADGTAPAVVASGVGQLTVAVQGLDGQVWSRRYSSGQWGNWRPMGGLGKGGPSLSSPGTGQVVATVKGLDDAGWSATVVNGDNRGWKRLGGVLRSAPTSAGRAGTVHVVTVGADGKLYRNVQTSGAWSGWGLVG